ncbi:MAG: aldehyde ferredoxin oxidoreductase family protein [Clostridia bacterium]|nr:aldehyde ferredoxin oxidoreductase family protein [Clostridia bacterium]
MTYGFYGKILHIDLTNQSHVVEEITSEVLSRYLGGKGLGTYLLLREVPRGIDPLSPENKLIFSVGSATGTTLFGSNRYGVFSKSPLTGGYSESYSGGKVAGVMKKTGYDAIVVGGKSEKPCYLEINDEIVLFHKGEHLWGKDCYETEDLVLQAAAYKDAQAVVIGPAGENMVKFACIENNYWRSAGRTGLGAVCGSKNLKAIVFSGKAKCSLYDEEGLMNISKSLAAAGKDNPGVSSYQKYGTSALVGIMNSVEGFPTEYWSKGKLEGWESISGDEMVNNYFVASKACPPCFLKCGKLNKVLSGKHAGLQIEGPEYETLYSFGGLCKITAFDEIMHLNDICDKYGMDTITAGNLVAFALYAGEKKKIDIPYQYGDAAGAEAILMDIIYRRGIGAYLADGIVKAGEQLGLQDEVIHVKGLEPAGYDPRVLRGMGLAYATSPRGACHLRATFYKPELVKMIDPRQVEGKAQLFVEFEDRLTIFDTMIQCRFYRDLIDWNTLNGIIRCTTGFSYETAELKEIAGRIVTATKIFNVREGFGRKDDRLPLRFFKEDISENIPAYPEEDFNQLLTDYYRLRGWDDEGIPKSTKEIGA